MLRVDLNCDLGEGCGDDKSIMPLVTSANIACGYHAGDVETMRRTVDLAIDSGVNIGAHPGYAERENFGRTNLRLSPKDVYNLVGEQITVLAEIARVAGAKLRHVKPHGALYNQAANDAELAGAIAEAVRDHNRELILFGLSGSLSIVEAAKLGLRAAAEVFADRTYRADGTLTPRSSPNALITDQAAAAGQAVRSVKERSVTAVTGDRISVRADTICIHGDSPMALRFAVAIRRELERNGIEICAP